MQKRRNAIALAGALHATCGAAAPAIAPASPVDAERAFAADAQKIGQWTAFRKYATEDAVMFTPHQANAHALLKKAIDPPVSVFWWPGRSYVSCDGSYAVNTGPWVREWGKSVGYFTTVWERQPDGAWKWLYDGGDELSTPRAEGGDVKPVAASCEGRPSVPPAQEEVPGVRKGAGRSGDGTLHWLWSVEADGERQFRAYLWNGSSFDKVIEDRIAAPPQ